MNYIENLLQGQKVKWKTLGEVAGYKQPTPYIVKSTEYSNNYKTPVLTAGQSFILGYTNEENGIYEADEKSPVIIFDDFTTSFHWVDFPFKVKSSAMKIIIPKEGIDFRFVYHAMKTVKYKPEDHARQWISKYSKIKIPLPPLAVQQEIANILDTFTTLEAELEAELDCRKRQYHHYRDTLLTFGDDVEWKTLGEVGEFIRGTGLQKKDFTETGVPAIHYGQIYTKYGNSVTETISFVSEELAKKLRKVNKGDVVITNTSENLEDVGKSLVYLGEKQAVTGGHATIIKPNENLLGKYLVYYTQTNMFSDQKRKYAKGTKVIDVSATDMQKIQIPLPPLEEQKRIVNILDKFDTLINSITEGLPKEIELRRKQYEYYREQLLMFNYQ